MICKYSLNNFSLFLLISFSLFTRITTAHTYASHGPNPDENSIFKDIQLNEDNNFKHERKCLSGWLPIRESPDSPFTHCAKVFMTFRMTWQQAEEGCKHWNGAHLISIKDEKELSKIDAVIQTEVGVQNASSRWISQLYKKTPNLGWWIGFGQLCPNQNAKKMPEMRWTDGEMSDIKKLTKIGDVEVRVPKIEEWSQHYCLSYHFERDDDGDEVKRYFNMSECTQRRNFICKMPALQQDRIDDDLVLDEHLDEKSAEVIEENRNEMSLQFPCGTDPLYCPMKDENGETICYHLLTKQHFWQQARESCEVEYESDLASIHSKKQSEFIYQMIMIQPSISGETKYWIGLHRRNAQRQYLWSDDTALNYMELRTQENEDEDEGNEYGACNAMKLKMSAHSLFIASILHHKALDEIQSTENEPDYSWIHQRCDNKRLAICQKPGFGSKLHEITSKKDEQKAISSSWKCPDGYKLFRGMCYKVFGLNKDPAQTFDKAKKSCEELKSTLVSLTDPYEQGFVLSMLYGVNSDAWIGMDMTKGRIRWLDAEPVRMTRFSPDCRIVKIGNDRHVFQNAEFVGFAQDACVSLDATTMIGYWDLTFNISEVSRSESGKTKTVSNGQCSTKKLPYICEKYAEKSDQKMKHKFCYSNGAVTYCFPAVDPNKHVNGYYNFTEAAKICSELPKKSPYNTAKNNYGQTAQVDDLFEWSFMSAIALQNGYQQFYMGVRFDESSGFVRTDARRIRLAPWSSGEPNLRNGNCVMTKLTKAGPSWFMVPCSDKAQLVCRFTKEKPLAEIEPEVRCPKGKEDWILGETHCYHLVTKTSMISTGYKAEHDCFKFFNATLASFETQQDFDKFKERSIHQELDLPSAFIGLIKRDKDAFAWKDLSPLTFVNWDKGEPSEVYGRDNFECVKMNLRGAFKWQKVACWQNLHYICSVRVIRKDEEEDDSKSLHSGDDEHDIPDLPSHEDDENENEDNKHKAEDEKQRDMEKSNEKESKIDAEKEDTTSHESDSGDALDSENDDSDSETNGKSDIHKGADAGNSSSGGGISIGGLIGTSVGFLVAIAVAVIYWRRRRTTLMDNQQRIMQFDALQNADEYDV